MPRTITENDIKVIAKMIREWPKHEPFKWESICKGSEAILGYEPTRQALNKKPVLVNAYLVKKKQLKGEVEKLSKVARPRSMTEAIERLSKLLEKCEQLEAEIGRMAEVANRFIYNASIKGLTPAQLMKPLPKKNDKA